MENYYRRSLRVVAIGQSLAHKVPIGVHSGVQCLHTCPGVRRGEGRGAAGCCSSVCKSQHLRGSRRRQRGECNARAPGCMCCGVRHSKRRGNGHEQRYNHLRERPACVEALQAVPAESTALLTPVARPSPQGKPRRAGRSPALLGGECHDRAVGKLKHRCANDPVAVQRNTGNHRLICAKAQCHVPGFENAKMKLVRHVSFVDCPGHDILMATMLNGAAVMDGALLLIAANESCPQPQTSEHLAAVEIMQLKNIVILQNKIDLVSESAALNQHEAIRKFIQGTIADGSPVVPVSAQLKYNIDTVCEYLIKRVPVPVRDFTSEPNMIVIRSFDVNKPGACVDEIEGFLQSRCKSRATQH